MWPYPWTHVGTPSHLGHMDRVAATMPSQAHAGAAQEAPDIGQWEGQDVPLVRPSSCNVKGGIPSSRRYLRYLPTCVPGAVGAGVGTLHRPHNVRPCGSALLAVGVAEGRPRGGVLSAVARGAWCQALSLPWPPVLWSGRPGFRVPRVPGAVGAGVGTQHRPHSVRPCGPALLAVGVAEGRPQGGAFHRCEGRLVSGAVPPSAARPLERAARVPRPVCPGCGRCGRGDPSPA